MKKLFSGIMLTLILASVFTLASNIQPVKASGTINIKTDVSIDSIAPLVKQELGISSVAPSTQWNKTYGGTDRDEAYSVVQTNDGGYALAGFTYSFSPSRDGLLVKTDANGNMQWNKTYGGTEQDTVYSMVQTSDGGYALAGGTSSFNGAYLYSDFWLIKTDSSGNVQWNKTYAGSGGDSTDEAYSIVQTNDGGYALTGYTELFTLPDPKVDLWLVKTDADGNALWNKTYGGYYWDFGYSVIQTSDGGIAVAGALSITFIDHDFWLFKTDQAGNLQWSKTWGENTDSEYAYSVIQTNDGGFMLVGETRSWDSSYSDVWIVKTDNAGNMVWNQTFGSDTHEVAKSVVQTNDGGYIVAGVVFAVTEPGYDFWVIKTDATGESQWNQTYGGSNDDYARSVVQTSDDGYAIAGYTLSHGDIWGDFWLVKLGPEMHDVSVTDVVPSKTEVGQGLVLNINVTIGNEGNYREVFNVTTYANTTIVDRKEIALTSGTSVIVPFQWNTTEFDPGNYTVSAVADAVANETDTSDNSYIDGIVKVRLPFHDIAVMGITPSKNVVGQGYSLKINVTAVNEGDCMENFNVTVYANATSIATQNASLSSGNSAIIVFAWNTVSYAKGNYTIKAVADTVTNETDVLDNTRIDGWVKVTIPGDVTEDELIWVDMQDIDIMVAGFMALPGAQGKYWHTPTCIYCPHTPNCDVNDDNSIDMADIQFGIDNFFRIDP